MSAVDIARWRAAVDEYFVNTMGSARWGPGAGAALAREYYAGQGSPRILRTEGGLLSWSSCYILNVGTFA